MKINPVEPRQPVDPSGNNLSGNNGTQGPFAQIFEKALTDDTTISATIEPSGIKPSIPVSVNDDYQMVDRMEKSLDHLERYCKLLGDPKVGIKALAEMTDRLRQDALDFGRMAHRIDTNSDIQPLIRETRVLLTKEIARFEQGGYLE
jgi:hypothetical protein